MIDLEIDRDKGISLVSKTVEHLSRTSIIQSVKNSSKKIQANLEKQIESNRQSFTLTIRLDQENFGTINFASHSINQVLGYTPEQLKG